MKWPKWCPLHFSSLLLSMKMNISWNKCGPRSTYWKKVRPLRISLIGVTEKYCVRRLNWAAQWKYCTQVTVYTYLCGCALLSTFRYDHNIISQLKEKCSWCQLWKLQQHYSSVPHYDLSESVALVKYNSNFKVDVAWKWTLSCSGILIFNIQ